MTNDTEFQPRLEAALYSIPESIPTQLQERRTMLSSKFPIYPLGPDYKPFTPGQPHLSEISLPMRNFTQEYKCVYESYTEFRRLNEMIANLHDDFGDEGFRDRSLCVDNPYFPCVDCPKDKTPECIFGDEGFEVRESALNDWLYCDDTLYVTYILTNLHDDFGDEGFDDVIQGRE